MVRDNRASIQTRIYADVYHKIKSFIDNITDHGRIKTKTKTNIISNKILKGNPVNMVGALSAFAEDGLIIATHKRDELNICDYYPKMCHLFVDLEIIRVEEYSIEIGKEIEHSGSNRNLQILIYNKHTKVTYAVTYQYSQENKRWIFDKTELYNDFQLTIENAKPSGIVMDPDKITGDNYSTAVKAIIEEEILEDLEHFKKYYGLLRLGVD